MVMAMVVGCREPDPKDAPRMLGLKGMRKSRSQCVCGGASGQVPQRQHSPPATSRRATLYTQLYISLRYTGRSTPHPHACGCVPL